MSFYAQTTLCLLTILIAAKGSGVAQFRYQKHEKAVVSLIISLCWAVLKLYEPRDFYNVFRVQVYR